MKRICVPLAAALTLSTATAMAQFPPIEPIVPIPDHVFDSMPDGVARQLRRDIARVNCDLSHMLAGQPVELLPPPGDLRMPPLNGSFRHREETCFSCVNGAFTLQQRVNGLGYRIVGTMHNGPLCVTRVVIDDCGRRLEYASLDDLPPAHRGAIRDMLRPYEMIRD